MGLKETLSKLGDLTHSVEANHLGDLVPRMSQAIRVGGDFPVSSHFQSSVRGSILRKNFRVEELPGELCHDLIIPIRLLALVNSTLYARGKPITDLEGVGSLLGITNIAEKLEELGEVGNLRQKFRGRSLALVAYENAILRARYAQRLYACFMPSERFPPALPFVLSIMAELPKVLLAYFKPNIYAACWFDAFKNDAISFERPFKRIYEEGTAGVFEEISNTIGLPKIFPEFVKMTEHAPWNKRGWTVPTTTENTAALTAAFVAGRLSSILNTFTHRQAFYAFLRGLDGKGILNKQVVDNSLVNCSSRFKESMERGSLPALRLPHYLEPYEDQLVSEDGDIEDQRIEWPSFSERLNPFVFELKACLKATPSSSDFIRYPQALMCTVLALLRGLNFDRCIVFLIEEEAGEKIFSPKIVLGEEVGQPALLTRKLSALGEYDPDKSAYLHKQAVFQGDPIIEDNWPFVAFPIIQGFEVVAVVYADKRKSKDEAPLTTEEQVSCIALAEEWHSVPAGFI